MWSRRETCHPWPSDAPGRSHESPVTAERAKYRIIDFFLSILVAGTDRRLYHVSGIGKEVLP